MMQHTVDKLSSRTVPVHLAASVRLFSHHASIGLASSLGQLCREVTGGSLLTSLTLMRF